MWNARSVTCRRDLYVRTLLNHEHSDTDDLLLPSALGKVVEILSEIESASLRAGQAIEPC
jgi:hypothetical protein